MISKRDRSIKFLSRIGVFKLYYHSGKSYSISFHRGLLLGKSAFIWNNKEWQEHEILEHDVEEISPLEFLISEGADPFIHPLTEQDRLHYSRRNRKK